MKIAIIGSGISGLLSAQLLAADTGFMVFNDRTYPNFVRMLGMLNVPSRNSNMSFSVRCDKTGLEYQGGSLNGLFAQRRNLVRPSFYRMLRDVLRFNHRSLELLQGEDYELTLGQYLDLEELPVLLEGGYGLGRVRFSPASFCRTDHLGDPRLPLAYAVQDLVEKSR